MNISMVFSTEQRVKILKHVIFETGTISVNEVSRETGTSKGLVSKYLNHLAEEGILIKCNNAYQVAQSPGTKAARILLSLNSIDTRNFKNHPVVRSAGLYGSAVKGTNTRESDVDMWILHTSASPEQLSKVTKTLASHGNVRPLYLTTEKIKNMEEDDPIFYYSLMFGSVTLYGEPLDAI
ncbi:winged helix-turn-helix transcriptional regulator [Candidatus Bathyarchaeota archaeon]|nr:winged helix-turn-helix transcriptional regulator [Candidatus Bathyarchaeota archaeon]